MARNKRIRTGVGRRGGGRRAIQIRFGHGFRRLKATAALDIYRKRDSRTLFILDSRLLNFHFVATESKSLLSAAILSLSLSLCHLSFCRSSSCWSSAGELFYVMPRSELPVS